MAELVGGRLVARVVSLFVERHQKIGGQHVIQGFNGNVKLSGLEDMRVDVSRDIVQQSLLSCSTVDKVLTEEIKTLRIAPHTKFRRIGLALKGRINEP